MPRNSPTMNQQPATPRAMAPAEPQMLTVKAAVDTLKDSNGQDYESPRVVYDIQDMPIPHDRFVTTPLTASLVLAIKAGDLEEADEGTGDVVRITDKTMPAEFGGRPNEKKQKELRDRLDRVRQEQVSRSQSQQPAGGQQRERGVEQRPSQDRRAETRQEERQGGS